MHKQDLPLTSCFYPDRAIKVESDDKFFFQERIVNKISCLIQDESLLPITIALKGEWGSGKSSVLNLLRKQLDVPDDKNSIVINFEPLLEGKLSIAELIEIFFLKLLSSSKIKQNEKIKNSLIKSLKRFFILFDGKFTIKGKIPGFGEAGYEVNPARNFERFIDSFDEVEGFKFFADEIASINTLFASENIKLFILIDDIDRLNEDHIINILLFTRTLEEFDSLACIVALDYEQVINKIIIERNLQLSNYNLAKSYLDKLFQVTFQVNSDFNELICYTVNYLNEIDSKLFYPLIKSEVTVSTEEFFSLDNIVHYLATPRQIKKWILSIKLNYKLLETFNSETVKAFLGFLAVAIRHPITIDNLSKHARYLLTSNDNLIPDILQRTYGVYIGSAKYDYSDIITMSIGFFPDDKELSERFGSFIEKISNCPIYDVIGYRYTKKFFESVPTYSILIFVNGYSDSNLIAMFKNFFEGPTDKAIKYLCNESNNSKILAADISKELENKAFKFNGNSKVDIKLVNQFWSKKISDIEFSIHPYYSKIIQYTLLSYSLEDIILQAELSLSCYIIDQILTAYAIPLSHGVYNLHQMNTKIFLELNSLLSKGDITFNNKSLEQLNAENISNIFKMWIQKLDFTFVNILSNFTNKHFFTQLLFTYIYFNKTLSISNASTLLAAHISDYLSKAEVDASHKKLILEAINEACFRFKKIISMSRHQVILYKFGLIKNQRLLLL
jgi:hypothetical protein